MFTSSVVVLFSVVAGFAGSSFADEATFKANPCLSKPTSPAGEPCATDPKYDIVGKTLYIEGRVDSMLYDLLRSGLESQINRIEVNSYGGSLQLDFIYMAAEIIRTRGITTSLRDGARCASACTIIYQAGRQRVAHPNSWLGYHGARSRSLEMKYKQQCPSLQSISSDLKNCEEIKNQWIDSSVVGTQQLFLQLERLGASKQLFADYQRLPKDSDWIENGNPFGVVNWTLSAADALEYGVVNELHLGEFASLRSPKRREGLTSAAD